MKSRPCLLLWMVLLLPFTAHAGTDPYAKINTFNPSVDPTLRISRAWIRPSVKGDYNTAAYMTIEAPAYLSIQSIYTPEASSVEAYEHIADISSAFNNVKKVDYPISINPGYPFIMKPHEKHLLLRNLKRPLLDGEKIIFVFHLKSSMYNNTTSAAITAMIPVRAIPPAEPKPAPEAPSTPKYDEQYRNYTREH